MADTLDDFGRTVKASFDDLKTALLKDLGQQKENAKKKAENTEEIKKLNDKLENIIGKQLNAELKALNKLVKKVADCCENVSKSRGRRNTEVEKEAKIHAKAIAGELKGVVGKGGDVTGGIEKAIEKRVLPSLDSVADRTLNFGQVLERSQRRFSTAFKMIGKQFQSDFGSIGTSIKEVFTGFNPFKLFSKMSADAAEESSNWLKQRWDKTLQSFKDSWTGITNAVSNKWSMFTDAVYSRWERISEAVSSRWSKITDGVKEEFSKAGKYVSDKWQSYGQPLMDKISTPFKAIGSKIGQYVGPLGKAAAGTVKDFFRMGKAKTAGKDVDDLLADPTKKAMGEAHAGATGGDKAQRQKSSEGNLCRCICKCISRLMGVGKESVKIEKDTNKATKEAGKVGKAKEMALAMAASKLEKVAEKDGEQQALMREFIRQESRKRWDQRGQAAKGKALYGASAAQGLIFGGRPMETLLNGAAVGLSKTAGWLIEKPLGLVGDILAKSTIPGLSALGPIIGAFGSALGGLAEGLARLVLTPLITQVEFLNDATKSMYVSRGNTYAPATISAGKAPDGSDWSELAKTMMEVDRNMESMSKTLDVLGTKWHDVAETGQDFETIQRKMLKNFRRGIRDSKDLNKVTKTGLQTAYLLDANAEHTADMFADWHQTLGMSSVDLRSMQRGMTQIARSTGLVGDNLIEAAKSAGDFMDNMRKAGTLTAESSRSLIEMMARAKLTGTEGAAKSFAKILSQGRLRGNLSGHEQTLAAIGGGSNAKLIDAITFGVVQGNKEFEMEFANNLEGWLKAQVGGDPTKSLDENMKKLSAQQISRLSFLTQQLFGMGAKEFQLQIKNMQKGAQSFTQNLADLDKSTTTEAMSLKQLRDIADKEVVWRKKFDEELAKAGGDTSKALDELLKMGDLPIEMRKQFEGQLTAQSVAFQKQQLYLTTGADLMDKLNKIMDDGGKNVDGALEELAKGSKDFREYLGKIGTDASKGGMAIEKVLEDQAKRLREEAEKFGVTDQIDKILPNEADIRKALKDNDKAALKLIAERFGRAKGVLETTGMKNTSPMELIKQYLNQIAGMFNELMQAGLKEVLPMLMHAIKDLTKAPFWKAFREGDLKKGFELLGDYVKSIVPNIQKAMKEIGSLAGSNEFREFVAMIVGGIATAMGPLLAGLGDMIKNKAPGFAEFIEKARKFFAETDWTAVGTTLATISAGIVKMLELGGKVLTFLGPEGTLVVGLLALVAGLGGLSLAINPVVLALAAGAVALGKAKSDFDNMIKARTGEISKSVDERAKATDKKLEERAAGAPKLSEEEIKAKIIASEKEIKRLQDVANKATAEMADNINSVSGVLGEASVGTTAGLSKGTEDALNSITKAQNDERRLIQQMKDELASRTTSGKTPDQLAAEAAAAKGRADAAQGVIGNKYRELAGITGGAQLKIDDIRGNKDAVAKLAGITGKSIKDIEDLLWKHYSRFGTSDDAAAQAEINRMIEALPEIEKAKADFKAENAKIFAAEEALKKAKADAEAKAKAAAAVPPPPPPPAAAAAAVDADKKLAEMASDATTKGSIYTHDVHLEKLLTDRMDGPKDVTGNVSDMFMRHQIGEAGTGPIVSDMLLRHKIGDAVAQDNRTMDAFAVTPRLPGAAKDAENELRRKKAELMSGENSDMSTTEANTGATAANTRATAKAVSALGKLMAKFLSKVGNGGLSDVSSQDYAMDAFFNDALSIEWPSANPDRQPGLDVDGL